MKRQKKLRKKRLTKTRKMRPSEKIKLTFKQIYFRD